MTLSLGSIYAAGLDRRTTKLEEHLVKRDGDKPLSFNGKRIASISDAGLGLNAAADLLSGRLTLEIYETKGGKFIGAASKGGGIFEQVQLIPTPQGAGWHKAAVFGTIAEVLAWFKPGRLTDALREQLGYMEPERID